MKSKPVKIRENIPYKSLYETYQVDVWLGEYMNGNSPAIWLTDHTSGESVATATVNIPELINTSDTAVVKNYSENEGILPFLLENEIVADPIAYSYGYVTLYVCELLSPSI